MENKIIAVRFKKTGKLKYFDPLKFSFSINDSVVAKTERGEEIGRVVKILDRNTLNDIFELGDDTFVGYFSSSPITDIDENYIGQVITAGTMASISTQLLSSMGSMMNMFCYFAIIVFVIVLYLLSKLIIERNTLSISMSKILGYTNKEIARLYIISTTIVVIFASLISIPICYKPLLVMFYEMLYTQMSGWIPFVIDKGIGVKMVFMNIVVYMFVFIFEYRRINKVPMDEALKNVE